MDPVDLTELMERTKNIEMILQEISTGRPYTVAVGMLVAQVLVLLVGGGFSWGAKEIWGAMKDQQAKRDEINQQLLLIPGEVKKTYEITVEEIKARSHSLNTS
ncbi:MAG: hypothetical protein IPN01_08700 [Deltaproteobacteria bacterium]|nr:hypothetical protein [Deltaproteobacteria bacterium]